MLCNFCGSSLIEEEVSVYDGSGIKIYLLRCPKCGEIYIDGYNLNLIKLIKPGMFNSIFE